MSEINVRENRMRNQKWTIEKNWQHWVHETEDEDKKHTAQKSKMMSNTYPKSHRG